MLDFIEDCLVFKALDSQQSASLYFVIDALHTE